MDSSKKQQASILLQIHKASVHHFLNGQKAQISTGLFYFNSGNCKFNKLVKEHSETIYFLVIGQFYYTLTRPIIFAKVQYPYTFSYLFSYWQSGICAISFHITIEEIAKIDELLGNTVTLMTFHSAMQDPKFSQSIILNCPSVQQHEIDPPSKLKMTIQKASQYIGSTLWTATHYLADQTEKTEKQIVKKYEEGKRQLEKKQRQTKQQLEKKKKALEQITDKNWNKIKQGNRIDQEHELIIFAQYMESDYRNQKLICEPSSRKQVIARKPKVIQNCMYIIIKIEMDKTSGVYVEQTTQGSRKTTQQLTEKTVRQCKQNEKNDIISQTNQKKNNQRRKQF